MKVQEESAMTVCSTKTINTEASNNFDGDKNSYLKKKTSLLSKKIEAIHYQAVNK